MRTPSDISDSALPRRGSRAARAAGCLACLLACSAPGSAAARPTLRAEGDPSSGFVTLSWEGTPSTFQLQEARSADFDDATTRYEGRHTSTVLSGLPDGRYFYRVREKESGQWGEWSTGAEFHVQHHSVAFAALLFGIGAAVFLTTVLFVLRSKEEY